MIVKQLIHVIQSRRVTFPELRPAVGFANRTRNHVWNSVAANMWP